MDQVAEFLGGLFIGFVGTGLVMLVAFKLWDLWHH